MSMRKLLYFVTEDWFFCSHWQSLATAAKEDGYDVTVVTRVRDHGEQIRAAGFHLLPLEMLRGTANPLREIEVVARLVKIYRECKPDIVHHMGQKPMIYGGIAAGINRIPLRVSSMMGLGYLFIADDLKVRIVRRTVSLLFRLLLNRPENTVILENPDDLRLLIEDGILRTRRFHLIRGAGVDPRSFSRYPDIDTVPLVVMASRLLRDKGVVEFVEAAEKLMDKGVRARFALVGDTDAENPTAIDTPQLDFWRSKGLIELWGYRHDMAEVLHQAHIVCLPSYREGLPKVLLEAAACGKPIVATDVPGCREVVRHNETGLLVPARDSDALAEAIEQLVESKKLRERLGKNGRCMIEQEFTCEMVNSAILDIYRKLVCRVEKVTVHHGV